MATLRETADNCCKKVYIGTAVLPKPLFVYDHDDVTNDNETNNNTTTTKNNKKSPSSRPQIKCATISTIEPNDPNLATPLTSPTHPTRYAQTLTSEFNSVVIEHHLKWAPLVHTLPGPIHQSAPPTTHFGKYDFHHVDQMVDYALRNNLHVKGHVLVWHVTSPPFLEDLSPKEVRQHLKRHIFTTMGYFKDRIQMWDVVNEALASDGSLVENVFYRKLGPGYIEECFRWAHEADPSAFLIYNDNKVEGCGEGYDVDDDDDADPGGDQDGHGNDATTNQNFTEENVTKTTTTTTTKTTTTTTKKRTDKSPAPNQSKSDGFYKLLQSLVQKGVPIHGAGMQAHFNAGGVGKQRCPSPAMVKRQIRRIGKLGLMVNISEMDVRVSKLPSPTSGASGSISAGVNDVKSGSAEQLPQTQQDVRNVAQTQIYRDILSAALSEPAFHGIWLWGFTDRHTWVTNFYYDDAPLIFDKNYNKKTSYYGIQQALKTLTCGGRVGELSGGDEGQCFLEKDFDEEGRRWGYEWMQPEPAESHHKGGSKEKDTTKEGNPDWMQPSS